MIFFFFNIAPVKSRMSGARGVQIRREDNIYSAVIKSVKLRRTVSGGIFVDGREWALGGSRGHHG